MNLNFKKIEIINEFLKFSVQSIVFYSMYIGVKKAMDLWVNNELFFDFLEFCEKYDIFLKYDIKFVDSLDDSIYRNVIGKNNLTTTKTIGEEIETKSLGKIHCFISMNKEYVDYLYKYGWYPIVVKNRVIYKSFHDLIEYGNHLGYPSCCIKFFFERNDWRYYNFLYEIYKRSSVYDYRCNSFWKDYFGVSYINHMPCNFGCEKTIKYTQKIIDSLNIKDPSINKYIEKYLLLPILSLREQKTYAFEGEISEDTLSIKYKNYYFLGNKNEGDLSKYLDKGNIIKIEGYFVNIYLDNNIVFSYNSIKSEEIEKPFIIKFSKF